MKKYVKLILMIILFILIITSIIIISKQEKTDNSSEQIITKIISKETFNLYLTDNNIEINDVIKFYKENYKLDVVVYNKKDNEEILNKLNIDSENITLPVFIEIDKGIMKSNIVGIPTEYDLKNYLINNKIIDNKYATTDNFVNDEEFKNLYNGNKKIKVLYTAKNEEFYKLRKELLKNNIEYLIMNESYSFNMESESLIKENLQDKNFPLIFSAQNGKIINSKTINVDNVVEEIKNI